MSRMADLPPDVQPYRRTPVFTQETVPAALTGEHSTKAGVWGVIHVTEGRLTYFIPTRDVEIVLDPSTRGIVEPEVTHRVRPEGAVSFFVEFWR